VADKHWLAGAAQTIRHYHERFEGTGYPDGLRGDAIPRFGRVFAVVDVFDALTSERPYKKPMALAEALSVIEKDDDQHFNPVVVTVFIKIAPGLYVNAVQVGDTELRQGIRRLLSRSFKMEAAPEGAAAHSVELIRQAPSFAMSPLEQIIEPHDFVAMHDDLLTILGFHHGVLLHAHGATELIFHAHFAVLEDVDRRAVFQLNHLFRFGARSISSECSSSHGAHRNHHQ